VLGISNEIKLGIIDGVSLGIVLGISDGIELGIMHGASLEIVLGTSEGIELLLGTDYYLVAYFCFIIFSC
jgi:hypothetical protein